MIKMIRGNFGLHTKSGVVIKTPQDEPFSCDKDIEARLVKDEFAVYVDEQGVVVEESTAEVKEDSKTTNSYEGLSYQQLKAEVKNRKLTPSGQKAPDLIAALIADDESKNQSNELTAEEKTELAKNAEENEAGEEEEEATDLDLGSGENGVN